MTTTIRFVLSKDSKAEYGSDDAEILGAISMRNCDIIIERDMVDSKNTRSAHTRSTTRYYLWNKPRINRNTSTSISQFVI